MLRYQAGVTALTSMLETHYGFSQFRRGQREVIEAIVEGRPVVAVMPTGAGKSLCYQLPALMFEGVTLVVSPLIALMKDQVDGLNARGIAAACINSSMDYDEQRAVLGRAQRGELKLLYVAPERFRFQGAVAALRSLRIALFAVDEAHCISQWGHDFRPDYKNLGWAAHQLNAERIAAFTATATRSVRHDIVASLGLANPLVTVAGFLRDNLHMSVVQIRKMKMKLDHTSRIIKEAGGSSIVYCATRKNCDEVAFQLGQLGHDVEVYHAGRSDADRTEAQESFQRRDDLTIVATNAFGMGVDKPNVRAVIHYDLPGSLDAYYQEAGRAGRDGVPSVCVLLFTYADTRIHEFFIDRGGEGLPADRRAHQAEIERTKLRSMVRYAYEEGCRHRAMLRYFGEVGVDDARCPGCDRCSGNIGLGELTLAGPPSRSGSGSGSGSGRAARETVGELRRLQEDEEVIVQKALSAVARAQGRLSVTALVRVLRGSRSKDTLRDPLADSKSYGILSGMSEQSLAKLMHSLRRCGCLSGRSPRLTQRGVDAMWRRVDLELDVPPFSDVKRRSKRARPAEMSDTLDGAAKLRFDRLRQQRIRVAKERGVPAYVVASNKLLIQIATLKPGADPHAWLELHGVGETNLGPLRDAFAELVDDDGAVAVQSPQSA